jgi:alginate O-acetyltransferase complex protein AlgI
VVFASPLFLFAFFPLFLALYGATPAGWANVTALTASLIFYAWGEPVFVLIAIGSALFDLVVVRLMMVARRPGARRLLVGIGVTANLGLLAYFKYANFAVTSLQSLAKAWTGVALPPMASIALPIGVSFIVFEKITYIVDVYHGAGSPARSVHDYLLYVFLFPKLLAGPIIKYRDIASQLVDRPKCIDDVARGLTRFAIGLAKKVLLGDPMGELADAAFTTGGASVGFRYAWLGAIAFGLQIFFDFSGYSDMAIGLARMMGFRLMENFKQPYLAIGFGDFWRRWHISLSTWIRDYLYIPLGGDRVSTPRLYLNLWLCFLASGLWHGAAWTFVLWGAYHGLFLTLDRLFLKQLLARLPRIAGIGLTFIAVTIGWVLFRAPDFSSALAYLMAMANPGRAPQHLLIITTDLYVVMAVSLAICFLPALTPVERLRQYIAARPQGPTWSMLAACALLLLSIGKVITVTFHPFLYFRF